MSKKPDTINVIMKNKKVFIIAVIVIIIIISAALIAGVASGRITTADIVNFFNNIFYNDPEDPPINPPVNPPVILDGNVLLVGDPLSGDILTIHFIDVGQADCILIEFPDGKRMMIDGGDNKTASRDSILNYLRALEIDYLDYFLLTHTHADHVGYLHQILNEFNAYNIFIPNIIASRGMDNASSIPGSISTLVYKNFMNRVEQLEGDGIATVEYNIDILFIIEETYSIYIYSPTADFYPTITDNTGNVNNMSPICVLEYAGRMMIFTGDAESAAELRFINQVREELRLVDSAEGTIDADVLKVGHHGSKTSSSAVFLEFIDVEYAVISAGVNNKHKHPNQDALDRLLDSGVEYIFRTDLHSHVVLEVDENGNMQFTTVNIVEWELIIIGQDSAVSD